MKTELREIPTITEETGDKIDKSLMVTYVPPSSEPVQEKILLPGTGLTEVWITGGYSDLIDIVSNRALVWRDYVRNDSSFDKSDIKGNDRLIAARAGRLNDLLVLYGLVYQGQQMARAVDVVQFFIRDGHDISVEVVGSEVFVTYGNHKDLRTRFLYSETNGWYRSPGNNRGGSDFPPASESVGSKRFPS
jgi:hypothetical protein